MVDFKTLNLQELALQELKNIRTHSTQEEWSNLVRMIYDLDGTSPKHCVYGLLTGSCHSTRAIELIEKCVVRNLFFDSFDICSETASSMVLNENTLPTSGRHYTPLEFFLYRNKWIVIEMILSINTQDK
jgi:hypothetical protein